jgi:phosphocarrier protein HPr
MVSKRVTVINESGLHLKPAANFCKEAVKFESLITFTCGSTTANAKSILSVLGACVKQGNEIEIVCSGPDEEEALESLCKAVEEGLKD